MSPTFILHMMIYVALGATLASADVYITDWQFYAVVILASFLPVIHRGG